MSDRPVFRCAVLGPLQVMRNGTPQTISPPKQRTLLAVLLLAPGRTIAAEALIDELWPGDPPPTAPQALQVHVSGLRKLLPSCLRTEPSGYLLDLPAEDVDAHRFESLFGQARRLRTEHPREAADLLAEALTLWRGPVFDGIVRGGRLDAAAARLTQLHRYARQLLAELRLAAGGHREIVADLAGWVAEHDTDEGLIRQYLLALHRCGRSGEAIAVYESLRERLDGLDVTPEEETVALAKAITRRDPTIEAVIPALPTSPGRFIGRRAELDEAARLLGGARLLTISGAAGGGKTRFAFELARETAASHPDGLHLVELAAAPEGSAVAEVFARIAAAASLREAAGEPIETTLAGHFGAARLLLLLDNCEQVSRACAEAVAWLLSACPGLRIVATSREPLGVPGEVVFTLAGLALPDRAASGVRTDAVRLFLDRADAARGGRRLTRDEEDMAVRLCTRLDGIPLAIELAAARLRAMSLPDLAARLDRQLPLLARVSDGAIPARHTTMRAAIDWSHRLLPADERVLLRRLSVFAGGFELAAAEEVGADPAGDEPTRPEHVLRPLTRLVDRSMLAWDGDRYRLIEAIREYAAERLSEDGGPTEAARTRDRHASWCAGLTATAPPLDGPAHAAWLARLRSEHDNIRAALDWLLGDAGEPERALRMAASLWWFWWVSGQMAQGRAWLGRALESTHDTMTGPAATAAQRAAFAGALRAAAALARNSGDLDGARRLGEQCLARFEELGDSRGVLAALNNLCITAQGQRDFAASLRFGQSGLALSREMGDERLTAAMLNNTAGTLRCMDRLDEAHDMFTQARQLFDRLGDRRGEAAALGNLGVVARRRGDHDVARDLFVAALHRYREMDLTEGVLDALEGLAYVDAMTGRPERALTVLLVTGRERARLGAPIFTPDEAADLRHAEETARVALSPAAARLVATAAADHTVGSTVDLVDPGIVMK